MHAIKYQVQLCTCSMTRHSAGQPQLGSLRINLQIANSYIHSLQADVKVACSRSLQQDMTLLVHNHPVTVHTITHCLGSRAFRCCCQGMHSTALKAVSSYCCGMSGSSNRLALPAGPARRLCGHHCSRYWHCRLCRGAAPVSEPSSLAEGPNRSLLIADTNNGLVRWTSPLCTLV